MAHVARASMRKMIHVPRLCDRCGHQYQVVTCVQATIEEFMGRNVSRRVEQSVVEQEQFVHNEVESFGVLCPRCQQFSLASLTRHFPDGFRAHLRIKLEQASRAVEQMRHRTSTGFVVMLLLFITFSAVATAAIWRGVEYLKLVTIGIRSLSEFLLLITLVLAFVGMVSVPTIGVLYAWSRRRARVLETACAAMNSWSDAEIERFVREEYEHAEQWLVAPPILEVDIGYQGMGFLWYGWEKRLTTAKTRWSQTSFDRFDWACPACGKHTTFASWWKAFIRRIFSKCSHCGYFESDYTMPIATIVLQLIGIGMWGPLAHVAVRQLWQSTGPVMFGFLSVSALVALAFAAVISYRIFVAVRAAQMRMWEAGKAISPYEYYAYWVVLGLLSLAAAFVGVITAIYSQVS